MRTFSRVFPNNPSTNCLAQHNWIPGQPYVLVITTLAVFKHNETQINFLCIANWTPQDVPRAPGRQTANLIMDVQEQWDELQA